MTWLLPDLRDPGIPRVERARWMNALPAEEAWGYAWVVKYPDPFEWTPFRGTNSRTFHTWREAVRFAVNQEWKR